MVNDATKKYREPIAFGLLGISALWFIGALSLLFKSDALGLPGQSNFSERSAVIGGLFESPIPVLSLVVAVVLVTALGGHTRNARVVVLAALGIGALDLLFGIITFFAKYGYHDSFGFSGIGPAGNVTGTFFGLSMLLFLAAALVYLVFAFQALPAPVAQPQWGAGQPGYGGGQPGWAQPGPGYGQQPTGWGQQSAEGWSASGASPTPQGWPQAQGGWGQQAPQQGWGSPGQSQPQQGWGQHVQGQPEWGQQTGAQQQWGQQSAYPGGAAAPQGYGQEQSQGAGPGWQWAHDDAPAPETWIQPSATYGESATSQVETASDPSWSQEEYGASASDAGWASQATGVAPDPVAPAAPAEPVGEAAYEGNDDTAAPADLGSTAQADIGSGSDAADRADPQSTGDHDAGDGSSDSGWWQPSQRS